MTKLSNLSKTTRLSLMCIIGVLLIVTIIYATRAILHGSLLAVVLMPVICGILLRRLEVIDRNRESIS